MNNTDVFSVLMEVIKDPRVVGTVIAVFLLLDFCIYVANYSKKPPKPKAKKPSAPPPQATPEGGEASSGGEEASQEE